MSVFRKWATKKVVEIAEEAAEPVRESLEIVKAAATTKTSIVANVVKALICLGVGLLIINEGGFGGNSVNEQKPSSIVINNYIYKEEKNAEES